MPFGASRRRFGHLRVEDQSTTRADLASLRAQNEALTKRTLAQAYGLAMANDSAFLDQSRSVDEHFIALLGDLDIRAVLAGTTKEPIGSSRRPHPGLAFDIRIEPGACSIRMANGERRKTDVLQGTLDLMVLQTLATLGPQHGYAIAARLEQVSNGSLQLNMGTLYPGLMRLEQRGLVRGAWGTTDNNRRARFYAITAAGRRELANEREEWARITSIMHTLLHDQS